MFCIKTKILKLGLNRIALRKTKTVYNFSLSECNRINCSSNSTVWFYNAVMGRTDSAAMANSIGPDYTAPLGQSYLGLYCLLRLNCPNT